MERHAPTDATGAGAGISPPSHTGHAETDANDCQRAVPRIDFSAAQPEKPMTDLDTPTTLTDWLTGTLSLVFDHGATVTRHVTLSTATEVRKVAAGAREPDRLHWCDTGWLEFERDQVVFIDFTLDEDGGWSLSADERRALDLTPYRRGVLVALRDYWQRQDGPEASYSARALATLHHAVLTNPPAEKWERLARAFEGAQGAHRVRTAHETVEREDAEANKSEDGLDLELDFDDDLDEYVGGADDGGRSAPTEGSRQTGLDAPSDISTEPESDEMPPTDGNGERP